MKHRIISTSALCLLVTVLWITAAPASVIYWSSTTTGTSWSDPDNWSEGSGVPKTGDDVWITVAGNANRADNAFVVMDSVSATLGVINVGQQAGTSGTLVLRGDSFIQTANTTSIARHGNGTLILEGNAQWVHTTANFGVLVAGVGTAAFTMSGSSQMSMIATTNNNFVTGEQGTGGVMRILFEDDANFYIAANTANNNRFYIIYGGGDSVMEIKDRAVVTSDAIVQFSQNNTRTGTATLTLTGDSDGNRGTLIAPSIHFIGGATADYTLDFNGGILKAGAASTNFISSDTSAAQLKIITRGDGAFIDSNGFDITIAASDKISISGNGGLTKLGAGALTLNTTVANTTYTGATVIEAGALILTAENHLATSSVITIAASSTLAAINLSQTLSQFSGAGVVDLGTGTATINNTANAVFSGKLTASDLIITTPGSFTLSGDNTVTGNITLNGGAYSISASSLTLAQSVAMQSGAQLAIDASAGNAMFAGAVTGNTGISKTGAGNLFLAGNLSGLSGAIDISDGGLFLSDYNGAGNITIADGAAFGGAGTITGNISFLGAGMLQVGLTHNDANVTTPSTLTVTGAVSFAGAATLSHDMYASGHDTIVAGSATFGSATNTVDLVNILSGTFTLIKLTSGTFNDSLVAPGAITTTQDGGATLSLRSTVTYGLNNAKNELLLISEKINHIVNWTGTTDNNWDSATVNWDGGDTKYVSGDKVIFSAAGSQTIDIMPTGVIASEMSITGDGSYTFTGGRLVVDKSSLGTAGSSFGGSSPTGAFTINTTGTVTLANDETNTFAGGINVEKGTLVGNAMTFGDATIVNNSRTVFFQDTTDATYTGTMTGAGAFVKTGASTLTVGGGLSAFAGTTDIQQGILEIADGATYGSPLITGSNNSILRIRAGAIATGSVVFDNAHVSLGADAMLGGASITNGWIQTGDNAEITGNLTLGTSSTLWGTGTFTTAVTNLNGDVSILPLATIDRTYTVVSTITGTGSLTKSGTGTLILSAPTPSSYSGPTSVLGGTLAAGSDNALSPNSAHTVSSAATLDLRGYNQTISSLTNHGTVSLGENGVTGGKLRINGAYTAAPGSQVHLSIVTADNAKTISGQLSFADAASISGTTVIRASLTDHRSNTKLIIHDMEPLAIADTGAFEPGSFILDDGQGFNRAILHGIDYVLEYDGGVIDLIATTAAELPAALAANVIGNIAGRAAFGSVSQRLDYLHAADTLPGSEVTGRQVWAQTYYRADELDGKLFPNSDGTAWGIQAGIDWRSDKDGNAYNTHGFFIDRTDASADLPNKTSADLTTTGIGGYISAHTLKNWQFDGALRYSWDSYKVTVGRRHMTADGYTWGAMLRATKINDLGKNWVFSPQAQLIYQNRKVNTMNDDAGRSYSFGPENMSLNSPSSLEGRVGASLRKLLVINDTISLAPYISAHFLYEFRGSLGTVSVNNTSVSEDFGGDSLLFKAGLPVRLGRRIDAYADFTLQTGGPITGYGVNLGINYRW